MQRCIDSGLWVPNAQSVGAEKGDKLEGVYEEVKKESSEEEKENPWSLGHVSVKQIAPLTSAHPFTSICSMMMYSTHLDTLWLYELLLD